MMRMCVVTAALILSVQVSRADYSADEPGFVGMKIALSEDPKGIKVEGLLENGPAEKAGVKAEDIVTKMDKKEFDTVDAFIAYIRGKKPGDKITLTIIREKKEKQIEVTIGKAPDPN
jgi:S1-C subfamily serine protease